MAWDSNDLIAAALIIALLAMGLIAAFYFLGWIPSVDSFLKFRG